MAWHYQLMIFRAVSMSVWQNSANGVAQVRMRAIQYLAVLYNIISQSIQGFRASFAPPEESLKLHQSHELLKYQHPLEIHR